MFVLDPDLLTDSRSTHYGDGIQSPVRGRFLTNDPAVPSRFLQRTSVMVSQHR